MSRKYLTVSRVRARTRCRKLNAFQILGASTGLALFCLANSLFVPDCSAQGNATFLGSQNCAASSCHGGAATNRNQFTVWSTSDFHHERPVATLETARSARLAEALQISDPAHHPRCTVCHAPLQTIPAGRLGTETKTAEGISCENCHGPAENWLRSHTRQDWTTADRVQAGMRDLRNIYVRANTCVACHQNVDPAIRRAGHPELIFELDGQSVTEPKHWPLASDPPGPQIWLVGQAVALREMIWQYAHEQNPEPNLRDRWEGLFWVVQQISQIQKRGPALPSGTPSTGAVDLNRLQQWSDEFAKSSAQLSWTDDSTRQSLTALAETSAAFADKKVSTPIHARRAERLVLALDRLTSGLKLTAANPKLNQALNRLFADVQSMPDFDPIQFARDLNEFHTSLSDVSP